MMMLSIPADKLDCRTDVSVVVPADVCEVAPADISEAVLVNVFEEEPSDGGSDVFMLSLFIIISCSQST
jgi:hypothetical protein